MKYHINTNEVSHNINEVLSWYTEIILFHGVTTEDFTSFHDFTEIVY